ncbi:MAG: sigma-70 family RNA polymerase sigma factor [Bacteroidetes bacterium]|nr:sigma-70 family RNA polymerase sigma factor [Bacteroidota bacterium]
MFAVCLYYAKDQTDAEDILHDGFMKVFKSIKQYKGTGSLEGWIKRIMINTALERFRKQNYLYSVEEVVEVVEDEGYENIVSSINFQDLIDLIRELSPQYRIVFNLYAVEGHSHKEIADLLEISVGTSKSNLARARKILQEKVKVKFAVPASQNKMVI